MLSNSQHQSHKLENLSDAAVRALTTLKFSFLSFFKTIDLKVIRGAKPELLSDIIVPESAKINMNTGHKIC